VFCAKKFTDRVNQPLEANLCIDMHQFVYLAKHVFLSCHDLTIQLNMHLTIFVRCHAWL